jgi:lysine N6-hydroxylase
MRQGHAGGPDQPLDVAGIGIGPFNLSLAALLAPVTDLRSHFFESRPAFGWHTGLLFDHAFVQSPYLKDLVTLADPTSQYSFLNYLARHRRLYRFIVSDYINIPRREFNNYFRWVCEQLPNLSFGAPVSRLEFDGKAFAAHGPAGTHSARHVVLGVGRVPNIPDEAQPYLCDSLFFAGEYLHRNIEKKGRRLIIIGGSQTGAELFYEAINDKHDLPKQVTWVNRRHNFVPFDESPFANELYLPGYTNFFYRQPAGYREALLALQKYSSDAILQPMLLDIYRKLYELDAMAEPPLAYRLLVHRTLAEISPEGDGWRVVTEGVGAREVLHGDIVILATGFKFEIPDFLAPLLGRISIDSKGQFEMNEDFSLAWDGPPGNRLYAHNAALHSHGWLDPNFASMAWRSSVIANSIAGRTLYDAADFATAVDWAGDPVAEHAPVLIGNE